MPLSESSALALDTLLGGPVRQEIVARLNGTFDTISCTGTSTFTGAMTENGGEIRANYTFKVAAHAKVGTTVTTA